MFVIQYSLLGLKVISTFVIEAYFGIPQEKLLASLGGKSSNFTKSLP
jgi:hypothetical protein